MGSLRKLHSQTEKNDPETYKNLCKCGKPGAEEYQTCPYSEEINGEEEECNCCEDCYQECLWDI